MKNIAIICGMKVMFNIFLPTQYQDPYPSFVHNKNSDNKYSNKTECVLLY